MNRKTVVMNKLYQYKELQTKFVTLCITLNEELPPGNEFGIEVGLATPISINLTVLDHPCRMVFGVQEFSGQFCGKITFQRLLPQEQTVSVFTAYFDGYGNATETPDEIPFAYSLHATNIYNWLAVRVLETFFDSIAPAATA